MKRLSILLLTSALLSACTAHHAAVPVSFLGDPIPSSAAEKTIEIHPQTKWVNVIGGESVRFVVGDQAFGWTFNVALGVSSFDLQRVAPAGMLNRPVIAYIEPDPKYRGGEDKD